MSQAPDTLIVDAERALRWLFERVDSDIFRCDCDPPFEVDTNYYNHSDDCASTMELHIESTLTNLEKTNAGSPD